MHTPDSPSSSSQETPEAVPNNDKKPISDKEVKKSMNKKLYEEMAQYIQIPPSIIPDQEEGARRRNSNLE